MQHRAEITPSEPDPGNAGAGKWNWIVKPLSGCAPPYLQPHMRSAWIEKRRGTANYSQMHYARQGVVTEEMAYVAKRENLPE